MAAMIGRRGLALVLALVSLPGVPASAQIAPPMSPTAEARSAWPADDRVMVLIKFIPRRGHEASGRGRFAVESCPPCVVLHDPAYERFNGRETILQLSVPRGRFLRLDFDIDARDADRAMVNRTILPIVRIGKRAQIELPPLVEDAVWAPGYSTEIDEPGMTLRFEHADPVRRAGAYATGPFPALERRAADNLSFALREAVRRLDIGTYVEREKIGRIMVMGFDTNYPAGHTDAPAHVHMHLRWAANVGTQIGHFYLNVSGLLTHNDVGIRALGAKSRRFGREEKFDTIDRLGRTVFSQTITKAGGLIVAGPDGRSCTFNPTGTGFQNGVSLDCGTAGATTVSVDDDLSAGLVTVKTGELEEKLRYDRDSGELLFTMTAPLIPSSTKFPE
jgi:hypothetical protein